MNRVLPIYLAAIPILIAVGQTPRAGILLWLGFHDGLADPDNKNPVLRQSTRLTRMAVNNRQSSHDPRSIRDLFLKSGT